MVILGIETSHDDSAVAILENGKIIKNIIFSQIEIHAKYGGTIPEIASREHVNNVAVILEEIKSFYDLKKIDYVAYTQKPGLIGALQIGYLFANAIAISLSVPLVPVNHLDGHFFSGAIDNEIKFPALGLLVSGGHSQIIYAKDSANLEIIGETLDDAVGEAYDKVARRLGLGFPGGPIIDKIYWENTELSHFLSLTKPKTENEYDFSLSGLKTQVINIINGYENRKEVVPVKEIAASFQRFVVEYVLEKFSKAIKEYNVESIVLAGGVSANKLLRQEFQKLHSNVIIPKFEYCTDNGAMIAKAAEIYLKNSKEK
ncbi:tRNA (adenosine(37)-N6)-threonylcarbamoyltransferase complex transferase subunit TsaD [Mycoplasma procyoni]|uniref:tRNA (adenosine(37)-N6)-threonylcarbamoyltransferase complex transferase subunit TsaD n=1 Tax=Mycoplasma procyoni TaxID=568784 RepID=UPI00197C7690|nr:tRNA (adenosine(37)-N6)-threonylcarbamoyltransferase complex transferase subunit TsaD [Mycoplasma procyoni]MBN3534502.1 tRNA (adenosine(37)-N6)-threonylcarbamoyltransferase complex transferase subunit TsaD [Mycoplasma procyoni]